MGFKRMKNRENKQKANNKMIDLDSNTNNYING